MNAERAHPGQAANNPHTPPKANIALAGATGDLGRRILLHLMEHGAGVKALVRPGSDPAAVADLEKAGAQIVRTDYEDVAQLAAALRGTTCVVSALSGLEEVIIGTQKRLLQAAVDAGVPRFIPSDFSIDYTRLPPGSNRNLDLRRTFNEHLDSTPIQATSILNGMFTDLLKGQAPVILYPLKRVVYWGNADQALDFTTTEDTAAYTARAAMDGTTPRYLRIAGEVSTARELAESAGRIAGHRYKLLRAGGLGRLKRLIGITKALAPAKGEVFPAWQGMQYMHNMFTGLPKLQPLDNNRYEGMQWTSVGEVIRSR